MKQSEASKKLLEFLRENDYIKENDQYGEIISRQIVEFMEDRLCMKPPHHPDRKGSVWCNSTSWDDEVYEWEDE